MNGVARQNQRHAMHEKRHESGTSEAAGQPSTRDARISSVGIPKQKETVH